MTGVCQPITMLTTIRITAHRHLTTTITALIRDSMCMVVGIDMFLVKSMVDQGICLGMWGIDLPLHIDLPLSIHIVVGRSWIIGGMQGMTLGLIRLI